MAMGPMYCQKLTCIFLLEVRPALLVYQDREKQPGQDDGAFYGPNQGDICLGGVNLNQLDKQALRQYINYLPSNLMFLMGLFWKIYS